MPTDDQPQITAQGQRKRGASPTHANSKSAKELWRDAVGEDKRSKGIIQEELETFTPSCGSNEPMSTDSQGLEGSPEESSASVGADGTGTSSMSLPGLQIESWHSDSDSQSQEGQGVEQSGEEQIAKRRNH
jgi:hypothetical protein